MRQWLRWRPVLMIVLIVADTATAAHWGWGAYGASMAFAASPAVCWLVLAPPGRASVVIGVVLVAFSVGPGLVFGVGGLRMYQVTRAGAWTATLYLPVTLAVVGIALLATVVRARRDSASRSRAGLRVATAVIALGLAVVIGLGCSWFELMLEDGETPASVSEPIAGLLPDDVRVVSSHWDGGSSVDGEEYYLAGTRGQSGQALAEEVSRSVAHTTGWPVRVGFGGQCYRAGGFTTYSGRYCVLIERPDNGDNGVVLSVESWDNRFGDFSPSPG